MRCPVRGLRKVRAVLMRDVGMLDQLRQIVRALERPAGITEDAATRPLGIAPLDATLGGGLMRGALHEIAAQSEAHLTAATGFALGLIERRRTVVSIAQDITLTESGALCGPGLDECGLAPERLITVTAARLQDVLWAAEEALRCRAAGAVIVDIRQPRIDAVALRRLSLAATASHALALILRPAPAADASPAATRWIVAAAPSAPAHGPGPPQFTATLMRNRRGPLGTWILEWSHADECLVLASTPAQPVARPVAGRTHRAARA